MRSMLAATWMCIATGISAQAQTTTPPTAAAKPKVVTTVPIRPALQTPADTANAMAQPERLALQSDLAWVGEYNGAITGEVSDRMVNAIKEFQKLRGGKQTGVLNPQERVLLAETARQRQESVGWKIVTDSTGARLGCRQAGAPASSDATGANGIPDRRIEWFCHGARKPTPPRQARRGEEEPPGQDRLHRGKPDLFVLSGHAGLKGFYLRGTFKATRSHLTILYDQATESRRPVVIAMSARSIRFRPASDRRRKTVEYTGAVATRCRSPAGRH